MNKAQVLEILEGMDIPKERKDIGRLRNRQWLQRNLAIRNGNHPKCSEVLKMIRKFKFPSKQEKT